MHVTSDNMLKACDHVSIGFFWVALGTS